MIRSAVVVTSDVRGGGERYLIDLYAAGKSRGLDAKLVGRVPGWTLEQHDIGLGPKWSRRRMWKAAISAGLDPPKLHKGVALTASTWCPDLFHMQYKREQILVTRFASRFGPVVWTEHGPFPPHRLAGPLRLLYRNAAEHVAGIICVSARVATSIADVCGSRAPRIDVIENGVDTNRFRPPTLKEREVARRHLGLPTTQPVVALVSRLIPWKRVDVALDTARRIPETMFLVAGDGPEFASLERQAPANVKLLGHLDDVRTVLHASDSYLHCADDGFDGLPLSLLEATSTGLPPVAISGTAVGEYADDAGGVTCERDARALAAGVHLAMGVDRSLVRRWAEERDLSSSAEAHVEFFSRCIRE